MKNFRKKIEGIHSLMKDMKAEKYAIVNPELTAVDEYIKNLYIKVLCTVIQYENEPSDMQVLFLKRLVCGMQMEESVEEYMRKALEISEGDIQEFISIFTEQRYKYYFVLDGLLLVSMASSDESYEYLAELIELIGITKKELLYLANVGKSVLLQDANVFDNAKKYIVSSVKGLNFLPYVKQYYQGILSESDMLFQYTSFEKSEPKSGLKSTFSERTVYIENAIINLESYIEFNGCEHVILKNCIIKGMDRVNWWRGEEINIRFVGCEFIEIEDCEFTDFYDRVINLYETQKIVINRTVFKDSEIYNPLRGRGSAGMIIHSSGVVNTQVLMNMSKVINCTSKANNYETIAEGFVANCKCRVENCEFYNVKHYSKAGESIHELYKPESQRLFVSGSENIGCKIVKSASFS